MIGKNQIQNKLNTLIFILSSLFLTSCSTSGYVSSGYNYSMEEIQRAIQDNLPLGLESAANNGRTFYSKIFYKDQAKKEPIFLVMKITILEDRRPYSLDIAVNKVSGKERRSPDAFLNGETFVGQDSLAKRASNAIANQLAKRRKDKNFFDDFRPF